MLTIVFNSMFKSYLTNYSSYNHQTLYIYASIWLQQLHHKICVSLTYMSWFTDFGVCHCLKAKVLVLMDTFETREFMLGMYGQIAYTFSATAAMHPCSLLWHWPVIMVQWYFQNCLMDNIIPSIVDKSDIVNDLILFIGHCDLHFMVQWFWHILSTIYM